MHEGFAIRESKGDHQPSRSYKDYSIVLGLLKSIAAGSGKPTREVMRSISSWLSGTDEGTSWTETKIP